MIEGVPVELLTQGGAWSIIAVGIYAILSGRLLPRSWVDRMLLESKERGDDWKGIATTLTEADAERNRQFDLLLDAQRTTNAVLESIRPGGRR